MSGDDDRLENLEKEIGDTKREVKGLKERLRRAAGHLKRINRQTTYTELVEIIRLAIGNVDIGGDEDEHQQR